MSSSDPSESYESSLGFLKVYAPHQLNYSCDMCSYQRVPSLCELIPRLRLSNSLEGEGCWKAFVSQFSKHRLQTSGCLTPFRETNHNMLKSVAILTICHPKRANRVEQEQSDSWLPLVKWKRDTSVAARWCLNKLGHFTLKAFGECWEARSPNTEMNV